MQNFLNKKKNILIIGGAGFIGHNLALKLKKMGNNVSVLDALSVNNIYNLKNNRLRLPFPKLASKILNERLQLLKKNKIPLKIIDARNFNKLKAYIGSLKPQVVIHLAAVSHADKSNKDPHSTFENSLRTLEHSLEITKKNIERFIFLSSSMVYGNFLNLEVKEEDRCNPLGIYGALKLSAENIIKAYGQVFNLPFTIIRPSALYGERCISRRVGQIFIESALNHSDIFIKGDGNEKLDFTYIDDLINGIVCSLKSKNSLQETFNITYGQSRKINELLEILKENFKGINVIYEKRDNLMPKRGTLSVKKAAKLIGYEPYWPLEKGYKKYIQWYKNIFFKKTL